MKRQEYLALIQRIEDAEDARDACAAKLEMIRKECAKEIATFRDAWAENIKVDSVSVRFVWHVLDDLAAAMEGKCSKG